MRDSTFYRISYSVALVSAPLDGEVLREAADTDPYRGEELAATLLSRVFQRFPDSLAVRLWNGRLC